MRNAPLRAFRRSGWLAVAATLVMSATWFATPAVAFSSHATETMPNLVGDSRATAYAVMHQKLLFFSTKGPGAGTAAWVRVTGQLPAAGSQVPVRSTIELFVTTVPAPHHVPVHHRVTTNHVVKHVPRVVSAPAPRVVGQGQGFTLWVARHRSLHLIVLRVGPKGGAWNVVLAQYPRPGVRIKPGAALVVTVEHFANTPKGQKAVPKTAARPHVTRPARLGNVRFGVATWYSYVPGRCATSYLRFGTKLYIKDLVTGHVVTCIVTDRQGSGSNRVVDLSETEFAELAPLAKGVVPVRVWW